MDARITPARITPEELALTLASDRPPLVIDVRRRDRYLESPCVIKGALRRDPELIEQWKSSLCAPHGIVVHCVHGHEVSQNAAKALGARYLVGGIEGWKQAGGALLPKPAGAPMRWVTRERPKIDRIACPWLVHRFVDADATFLYVPPSQVMTTAEESSAIPYDVADVEFSHVGERCSFDAFIDAFHLREPGLDTLAAIVRGADTGRLDLVPEAAGLAAISLGLSRLFSDDHAMLERGMTIYDALYAWCRQGRGEVHTWNPAAYR
jgi:rhodanese-related sulfurtransferase